MKGVSVHVIKLNDSRVVLDCLLVPLQLGQTISPIVERLNVRSFALVIHRTISYLKSIITYGCIESLKLSVNKASVGINDWVLVIKTNCLIEVFD